MNKKKIYFSKLKPEAIIPTKKIEDACYDVYACFEEEEVTIEPHAIKLIPTGIASACHPKYKFEITERGSTGSIGLATRCGQIDSGYRGEWFIALNNTTSKTIVITKKVDKVIKGELDVLYPYTKAIASVALIEVPEVEVAEISYEELKAFTSDRGIGKLGSSEK